MLKLGIYHVAHEVIYMLLIFQLDLLLMCQVIVVGATGCAIADDLL